MKDMAFGLTMMVAGMLAIMSGMGIQPMG